MTTGWFTKERCDLNRLRTERVEKAREQMKKDGIGAYLCLEQGNMKYLTDTHTFVVGPWQLLARSVLFPRTGDPMLYEWAKRYTRVRDELAPWLKGKVFPGWRWNMFLKGGVPMTEMLADLKKVLADHDVLNEPLAIDMPVVTADFTKMFTDEGIKVVDANPSLSKARMVKTQDEIECFKWSTSIAEAIFEEIRDRIRPGTKENDLAALACDLSLRWECDGQLEANICSGRNTYPDGLGYSTKQISPRDMVTVGICGARWRGYNSSYHRTFTCGKATQRQKELYAECRELLYKAINVIKPGVTTADICNVWPGPEHWGGKTWREVSDCAIGYGVGLDEKEPPTITPLFSREHPVTLKENMLISLKTYYGVPSTPEVPGEGARIENTVLVTKDGCEILTRWPDDEPTECWVW